MSITVASRRRLAALVSDRQVVVHDVTSRGDAPWVRLSPFFPHGGIPVPFTPGRAATSVEGIWQALKVFERADVDESKLDVTAMRGIKRTVRSFGPVLGHRRGLNGGDDLLGYVEARRQIYLPSYRWVLQNRVPDLVDDLRTASESTDVVLVDYTTNGDITDERRPLSHAALIARYVADDWPAES